MPRVEQVQQKALEEFRQRNRAAVKRKKTQNTRQFGEAVITFLCLFFLLSVLFLQVAKRITPKIDTEIGSNVQNPQAEQIETKESIDDRLKIIQFNDALAAHELQKQRESEIFSEELDEKVVLPQSREKANLTNDEEQTLGEKVQNIINQKLTEVETIETTNKVTKVTPAPVTPNTPQPKVIQTPTQEQVVQNTNVVSSQISSYKVLVGKYQTAEQAQLAKSIIRETTLGQNAFVKFIDNVYTIQIGSYSSAEQANAVANELTTSNLPARVYVEKQ